MPKHILIVEDDIVFCKLLQKFLEKNDYQTQDSQSAARAFELLEQQTFDLAVLDYRLPDQNGIEILRWLRTNRPDVQAVLMSRYDDQDVTAEARALGAADFITKPVSPKELLERLRRIEAVS